MIKKITTLCALSFVINLMTLPSVASAQPTQVLTFSIPNSYTAGKKALEKGEIDKAIMLLSQSVGNMGPELNYSANNHLCVAYYLKEDFGTAIDHCNRAIKTFSNKWEVYNNRGNIYLSIGKYVLAIKDYEKGLKLKGESKTLQENLRIAIGRQGRVVVGEDTINPNRNKDNASGNTTAEVADLYK